MTTDHKRSNCVHSATSGRGMYSEAHHLLTDPSKWIARDGPSTCQKNSLISPMDAPRIQPSMLAWKDSKIIVSRRTAWSRPFAEGDKVHISSRQILPQNVVRHHHAPITARAFSDKRNRPYPNGLRSSDRDEFAKSFISSS